MKIKTRVMAVVAVPVILLSALSITLSSSVTSNSVLNETYEGMESTALAITNIFGYAADGEYHLGDDGSLYKGDMNLSEATDIVDEINENTGLQVTVFYGDTRYLTSLTDDNGDRVIGTQASDEVVEAVLNGGDTFSSDNIDLFGTRYAVYYVPLYQDGSDEVIGMIFVGKAYEEISAIINAGIIKMIVSVIVAMVLGLALAIMAGSSISKPLVRAVKDLGELAEGKLGNELDEKILKRKDEIGMMYQAVQKVDDQLSVTISGVQSQSVDLMEGAGESMESTESVSEAVQQIYGAVEGVTSSVVQQSRDVEDAQVAVSEMGDMIQNTADEMEKVSAQALEMEQASISVRSQMDSLRENMQQVMTAVQEIAAQTEDTKNATDRISDAAVMVSNIADETNLLSLNAAIEAARAGEAGKGFAVVADQIQKLSEQSNDSAKQIQDLLKQLQDESVRSVNKMADVTEKVKAQEGFVDSATEMVENLRNGIVSTTESVTTVADNVKPLLARKDQVAGMMMNVESASQSISASMEETASSVHLVSEMAGKLESQATNIKNVAESLEESMGQFQM